jgi:hypothetical protein
MIEASVKTRLAQASILALCQLQIFVLECRRHAINLALVEPLPPRLVTPP